MSKVCPVPDMSHWLTSHWTKVQGILAEPELLVPASLSSPSRRLHKQQLEFAGGDILNCRTETADTADTAGTLPSCIDV